MAAEVSASAGAGMNRASGCRVVVAAGAGGAAPARPRRRGPGDAALRYPDFAVAGYSGALTVAAGHSAIASRRLAAAAGGRRTRRDARVHATSCRSDRRTFYPAETGPGLVALAEQAVQAGGAAVLGGARARRDVRARASRPGQAHLALDDVRRGGRRARTLIALDPEPADRTRLDLLRVRQVQPLIDTARRARQAEPACDEAADAFSARAGDFAGERDAPARAGARRARRRPDPGSRGTHRARPLQIDANDAETHAALGTMLEARGRLREAAAAYAPRGRRSIRNGAPRPMRRARREARSGLPDELRDIWRRPRP